MRRLGKTDEVTITVPGYVNIYGMDQSFRLDFVPAGPSLRVFGPDGQACMEGTENNEDICRHCNILYDLRDHIGFDYIECIYRL